MKKQYNLDEAIKKFYKSEPLKIDLAATVANKVFVKRKEVFVVPEKWLYVLVAVLIIGGIIYCVSLFHLSVLPWILIIIAIASYLGLSVKEYAILSKRLRSSV